MAAMIERMVARGYLDLLPDGADGRKKVVRLSAKARDRLPVLHEADVPIPPGTDGWPGFGLHCEPEPYAQARIPAPDVLALATLGAARETGSADDLGTIEPGKLADLILVDSDPTEDIRDTRRVTTVVKGGRVHDPAVIYRALGIEPCGGDGERALG